MPPAFGAGRAPVAATTMAYTVKQMAALSGVSVRTLHFYDEEGLLKPAYHSANGYRCYEEPQILILQQILFYRELGFPLKQIQRILASADFEVIAALKSHRKVLQKDLARTRALIATIDKTVEHLKGKRKMKTSEFFGGFTPEQQAKHEQYLIDRCGEGMRESIAQSKARVRQWTKADWEKSGAAFNDICSGLVAALERRLPAAAPEVQDLIRRHHTWMQQFWTPTRESYLGHSRLIVDSELRKAYEAHHPELPEYTAAAIAVFARTELD